jgi:RNA polymerase sigma-70 factor (ECF subfamily)
MLTDRRTRFEEIYQAYSGLILAYAARRTGDVNDAADVVAETFTVAWRRLDDVPDGEQARPWLYGVARRVLANQRRGTERRRRLHDRLQVEFAGPGGEINSHDVGSDLGHIAEALAHVTESDRELLTLVAWDGLSREEIAVALGCSATTVRVRLHRARKRLTEQLDAVGVKRVANAGHEPSRGAPALPDPEEA